MRYVFYIVSLFMLNEILVNVKQINKTLEEIRKNKEYNCSHKQDTITVTPAFMSKSPEDGLKEALAYYGVKHPDIVYAQAIQETGHFTSPLCKDGNNLFGLYNSSKKDYYRYNHWTESVRDYRDKVQYKYDNRKHDTYYAFLSDICYAEDKEYNNRIKALVKQNNN